MKPAGCAGSLRWARTLPASGAGVIGLEIASSARARGCAVTVIEAGPAVMGRSLPPEMASWLAQRHRDAGVSLRLGAGVVAIGAGGVTCNDGETIAADSIIAGIGMARNVDLAEAAGLDLDDGIAVDEFGRTSAPDVYAAGDVAAFWVPRLARRLRLESWKHAQDHGIAVGRSMAGMMTPYDEVPWFWTDQLGVTLHVAGLPAGAGRTVLRGDMAESRFSAWSLDAGGRVLAVAGVNVPRDVRAGQALIRQARPVDRAVLADPASNLARLAAQPRP